MHVCSKNVFRIRARVIKNWFLKPCIFIQKLVFEHVHVCSKTGFWTYWVMLSELSPNFFGSLVVNITFFYRWCTITYKYTLHGWTTVIERLFIFICTIIMFGWRRHFCICVIWSSTRVGLRILGLWGDYDFFFIFLHFQPQNYLFKIKYIYIELTTLNFYFLKIEEK